MGFGVWGLGFGVWGLGFGVWGLRFGVWAGEFGGGGGGGGRLCSELEAVEEGGWSAGSLGIVWASR